MDGMSFLLGFMSALSLILVVVIVGGIAAYNKNNKTNKK